MNVIQKHLSIWALLTLGALIALTGCASIVGETTQNLTINSAPDSAFLKITNENGQKVYEGQTPATVNLDKKQGYFDGASYTINLTKPGFKSHSISIDAQPNGWYIAGNLVFGGLIGWLVVDPATGAMWKLSPETVQANLDKIQDSKASWNKNDESIYVSLVKDVPDELRNDLQAIN